MNSEPSGCSGQTLVKPGPRTHLHRPPPLPPRGGKLIAKRTWQLICCSYCWVALDLRSLSFGCMFELWTKWMQRPNTRQTGPPHSPKPSSPTPPFSTGGKTNIAKRTWKLICCSYCATVGLLWTYVHFILGLCWPILGLCWCQSCSCWCSCCASGCSCFCSRCLWGCCAVEVVDVVGAVLCGASRNMLVCSVEFRSGEPPKSRIRVGFGFRVSGFVDWNQLSLSVSGFGFRRLKPTFAVGFGFRVSSIETHFHCRFRVSGFGFRRLKPTFAVGFGFRLSGFVDWS